MASCGCGAGPKGPGRSTWPGAGGEPSRSIERGLSGLPLRGWQPTKTPSPTERFVWFRTVAATGKGVCATPSLSRATFRRSDVFQVDWGSGIGDRGSGIGDRGAGRGVCRSLPIGVRLFRLPSSLLRLPACLFRFGIGHWSLVTGRWELGSGNWAVGTGQWELGSGRLTVGSWRIVFAFRCATCRTRRLTFDS